MPKIENDALKRKRQGRRIVDECSSKDYYCCGKKVNKNVWELQQLYETTQAKTTKVLPEFLERIRFMVVKGIIKATYNKQVDQTGELFNYTLEQLLNKIVPKLDPNTNKLFTRYDSTKTNLGAYILNSCYWSVIEYNNSEKWHEGLLGCSEFLEDYERASVGATDTEIGQLKFISKYELGNEEIPLVQAILEGENHD